MASRRKGRILAFQALYSWDTHYSQTGDTSIPEGLLDFPWVQQELTQEINDKSTGKIATDKITTKNTIKNAIENSIKNIDKMIVFSRLLVTGTIENIAMVDRSIQEHLDNWELKRLNRVDLAILRMSVYTMMFQDDIPPSVVIDEAVEISREFGTEDSYRFVNGVLDSIRKTLANKVPGQPETTVLK